MVIWWFVDIYIGILSKKTIFLLPWASDILIHVTFVGPWKKIDMHSQISKEIKLLFIYLLTSPLYVLQLLKFWLAKSSQQWVWSFFYTNISLPQFLPQAFMVRQPSYINLYGFLWVTIITQVWSLYCDLATFRGPPNTRVLRANHVWLVSIVTTHLENPFDHETLWFLLTPPGSPQPAGGAGSVLIIGIAWYTTLGLRPVHWGSDSDSQIFTKLR